MPDDKSSEGIQQQPTKQVASPEPVKPPALPDNPPSPPAQSISSGDMEGAIHAVENKVDQTQIWMVWLTAAIAFFALCSVGVGILQWNAMRGQLGEMKSGGIDTKNLATAAGNQAIADKDQVDRLENLTRATQGEVAVNREALESVQRAFVTYQQGLEALAVDNGANPPRNTVIEFRPRLENSGTTPTRNARNRISWTFLPTTLPDNFRFVDVGNDPTTSFIVGPRESMTVGAIPVPTDGIFGLENVRNHTGGHMYFWGWTIYRDVFKTTSSPITMMCLELNEIRGPDTRMPNPGQNQFVWANCTGIGLRHNCADEECNGEPYGNPTRIWPN